MDGQEPISPQRPQQSTAPDWIAGRIATLLSHYFQPETPQDVSQQALADWIGMLAGNSMAAINHACASYLRDQPRRRPTPGDIYSRARAFDEDAQRSRAIGAGRSPEFDRVAQWAERTGRLSREQAFEAMSGERAIPPWVPDSEVLRLVWLCRHHPAYIPQGREAA